MNEIKFPQKRIKEKIRRQCLLGEKENEKPLVKWRKENKRTNFRKKHGDD